MVLLREIQNDSNYIYQIILLSRGECIVCTCLAWQLAWSVLTSRSASKYRQSWAVTYSHDKLPTWNSSAHIATNKTVPLLSLSMYFIKVMLRHFFQFPKAGRTIGRCSKQLKSFKAKIHLFSEHVDRIYRLYTMHHPRLVVFVYEKCQIAWEVILSTGLENGKARDCVRTWVC